MQKLLPISFLVFALLIINVKSQDHWNLVIDDQQNSLSHVTDYDLFGDSLILVAGYVNDLACLSQKLFAYDLQGTRLWSVIAGFDAFDTDSTSIYGAGYHPPECVVGFEHVEITRHDLQGNLVFRLEYPEVPHEEYYRFIPVSMEVSSAGDVLIASASSVIRLDTTGSHVREIVSELPADIQEIISLDVNEWVVGTAQALYRTDSSLIASDSMVFGETIRRIHARKDTLWVLLEQELLCMDTAFNTFGSLKAMEDDSFRDMEWDGHHLWIQLTDEDSIRLMRLEDMDLVESTSVARLLHQQGFIITPSHLVILGESFSRQMALSGYYLGTLPDEEKILPDIEIIDFDISNIRFDYWDEEKGYIMGYWFDMDLTVKNSGTVPISTFAIFSDLHGGFNCAQRYYYRKVEDVLLEPGESHSLVLNQVYEEWPNFSLCFELLAPGSMLETALGNNMLCKTYDIVGLPGTEELNWRIYPNPSPGYIFLERESTTPGSLVIVDMTGKMVFSCQVDASLTRITLPDLPSGVYLAHMKDHTGMKLVKFLVE